MFCIFQLNFQRTKSKAINFKMVIYSVLLKTQHSKLRKSNVQPFILSMVYSLPSTVSHYRKPTQFPPSSSVKSSIGILCLLIKKFVKNYSNCQRTLFRQMFCITSYTCAFNSKPSNTLFQLKLPSDELFGLTGDR